MDTVFSNGQDVITPNGSGVVQGYYDGGRVLVRHSVKSMTESSCGECITPKGINSKLFAYPPAAVQIRQGGKR